MSPAQLKALAREIQTPQQLDAVMSRINPSSKDGPILLQTLSLVGKRGIVDSYFKNFKREDED